MRPVLITSAWTVLAVFGAFGQSASSPAFEVAAIKLNVSGASNSGTNTNKGEVFIRNSTLKSIIQNAYDVRDYSFSGPDWLSSIRFDISAKLPPDDPTKSKKQKEIELRLMLRSLLVERFKLEVHRETKTMPGYALLVGKKGPKLKDSEKTDGTSINTSISNGNGVLTGQGMPMTSLADVVGNLLHGPVADMTGLKSNYDIRLEWSSDDAKAGGGDGELKGTDSRPSLLVALQETLGLRIESRKIPVEILVVDHAEKVPIEN